MKHSTPQAAIPLLLLACASCATTGPGDRLSYNRVAISAQLASLDAEGPSITGSEATGDPEVEVDGVGGRIQAEKDLGNGLFLTGTYDYARYESSMDLHRAWAGLGWRTTIASSPTTQTDTYLVGTGNYAATNGTASIATAQGSGKDGDDFGLGIEVGVRHAFTPTIESFLAMKYADFGDGGGPEWKLGAEWAVTDATAVRLEWHGSWIEDAGYGTDLASTAVLLGFSFGF